MPTFSVDTSTVSAEAQGVIKSVQELETSVALVNASGSAAAGTPAAGACEAAAHAALSSTKSLYAVVEKLSSALVQAANNYQQSEQASTISASIPSEYGRWR
jgi:hypothetical protein